MWSTFVHYTGLPFYGILGFAAGALVLATRFAFRPRLWSFYAGLGLVLAVGACTLIGAFGWEFFCMDSAPPVDFVGDQGAVHGAYNYCMRPMNIVWQVVVGVGLTFLALASVGWTRFIRSRGREPGTAARV